MNIFSTSLVQLLYKNDTIHTDMSRTGWITSIGYRSFGMNHTTHGAKIAMVEKRNKLWKRREGTLLENTTKSVWIGQRLICGRVLQQITARVLTGRYHEDIATGFCLFLDFVRCDVLCAKKNGVYGLLGAEH